MKTIKIIDSSEVKDLVFRELNRRDKIISKSQIRELITQEVIKANKYVYLSLDKLRKRLNELEKK